MQVNDRELRGVLKRQQGADNYRLRRYFPSEPLKPLIEQFWQVCWDLPQGESHTQQNLPDPNCHLVIEGSKTHIQTVISKKFTYTMQGQGQIIGVKFATGSLSSLLDGQMSDYIDKRLPPENVFDHAILDVINSVNKMESDEAIVESLEKYFAPFVSTQPEGLKQVVKLLEQIKSDTKITKVEHLLPYTQSNIRSIQRLFQTYIGLSPKWLIRLYRLHQALKDLEREDCNILDIVERLDYTDQAHLIRDFKAIIGQTPGRYVKT